MLALSESSGAAISREECSQASEKWSEDKRRRTYDSQVKALDSPTPTKMVQTAKGAEMGDSEGRTLKRHTLMMSIQPLLAVKHDASD